MDNGEKTISALCEASKQQKGILLPALLGLLATVLTGAAFLFPSAQGDGELAQAVFLIENYIEEEGAIAVFLGLEHQEPTEEEARIADKAAAYIAERQ